MNRIKRMVYNHVIPFVGKMCRSRNRYVNIIYYHDIVDGEGHSYMYTSYDLFKRQMEFIAQNGYKTLRFDDLDNETLKYDSKTVLIAFDDGWQSNYSKIYELMKSIGLKYNIFLSFLINY